MTEDCLGVYMCQASGVVLFQSVTCKTEESCGVKGGVRGCHPKQCQIQSGGVFTPFDGQSGHVTASGSYELVNVCDQSLVSEWFSVLVTLEEKKTALKDMVALYVFFKDVAISVNDKHEVRVSTCINHNSLGYKLFSSHSYKLKLIDIQCYQNILRF